MILSTHLFCLLNLSTTPQLCSPLLLAYTFDVLDLIRQHNQPNTIRYLLCVIYYALYTMHYILCTMHYSLCTMHYALCTLHTYLHVFIRIYSFFFEVRPTCPSFFLSRSVSAPKEFILSRFQFHLSSLNIL